MKAVILAGGLGTRLLPYTLFLPKPMLPLRDKPIAEHLVEWVKKNGITSIVFCVSYMRKTIQDYFDDGTRFDVNIEYAISDKPMSTAGQLKTAENLLDDTFVCMYGDSIYDFNLRRMINLHAKIKALATMGLYEYKTRLPYGVIETSGKKVIHWNEKPEIKQTINMGCYIMEPEIFRFIPKDKPFGMDDVIKKSIKSKKLITYYTSKKGFIDIGSRESYHDWQSF